LFGIVREFSGRNMHALVSVIRCCGHKMRFMTALLALSLGLAIAPLSAAQAENRSLKIYFVHTGEKATITFKRNGKFDKAGLAQLNRFLRDWRRNEPTKMDPRLFDLIWEVYRKSGSRDYIHVVSAYRSPETNSMLRSRSKLVAEKSQHMLGKAMDFYLPDVKLATLRAIGMKMQVGGVGYYPRSGSPFCHMDVGGVRAWPRMSRQELVQLFPDGKTMHIPADGKPLPGYNQAVADYKRRIGDTSIEVADFGGTKKKGFFARLFGGGGDEDEQPDDIASDAPVAVASAKPAAPLPGVENSQPIVASTPAVATATPAPQDVAIAAPVPTSRPAFANQGVEVDPNGGMQTAMLEAPRSNAVDALNAVAAAEPVAFVDLSSYSVPVPQLLGARQAPGEAQQVASADPLSVDNASPLGFVPVPGARPAEAATLAEASNAVVPQLAATPVAKPDVATTEVAMLIPQTKPVVRGLGTAPEKAAVAVPVTVKPEAENTVDVASVDAEDDDDFFSNQSAFSPDADGVVKKGARPHGEANANGKKALTGDALSKWALSKGRSETLVQPVKAPRFASKTLRAQPVEMPSSGFSATPVQIDAGRFN
jgi:uncharacterized protein YcbK (DUF882 family)